MTSLASTCRRVAYDVPRCGGRRVRAVRRFRPPPRRRINVPACVGHRDANQAQCTVHRSRDADLGSRREALGAKRRTRAQRRRADERGLPCQLVAKVTLLSLRTPPRPRLSERGCPLRWGPKFLHGPSNGTEPCRVLGRVPVWPALGAGSVS